MRTVTAALASAVIVVGTMLGGVVAAASPSAATGSLGVAAGTPVTVRVNPDNQITSAGDQAAKNAGLGDVTCVGYHPDCSSMSGFVVICRDPSLHQKHHRASRLGPNSCVVRLDPSIGGAPHGVTVVTKALKKCVTK
jgi:hypothetical protein